MTDIETRLINFNKILKELNIKQVNIDIFNKEKDISEESIRFLNYAKTAFHKIFPSIKDKEKDNLIYLFNKTIEEHKNKITKYEKLTEISNIISVLNKKNDLPYTCKVCYSIDIEFYSLDCGHIFCKECCNKINNCPHCKRNKNKITKVYL